MPEWQKGAIGSVGGVKRQDMNVTVSVIVAMTVALIGWMTVLFAPWATIELF